MSRNVGKIAFGVKEVFPSVISYAIGVHDTRPNPRDSLATNLSLLMKHRHWTQTELAKRSKVDQKSISNMLTAKHAPNLDNVDKVAAAFGLTAWHLILPSLPHELVNGSTIERLFHNYMASDTKGRDYIDRVAEREAQYKTRDP